MNDKSLIKSEWAKCASNSLYFIEHYCKVSHPIKGVLPFILYPFQKELLEKFNKERYNLILKSRSMGCTTLISAFTLWLMTFQSNKNILIISIKREVSTDFVTKVRFAYENLPSWLKETVSSDNITAIKFKNGSIVQAISSARDAGRSKAISLLIFDEAAFVQDAEFIWGSSFNTLSTGGNAIVLSTPNGASGWFYNKWCEAEKGLSNFKMTKLPWHLHPERNQQWYDDQVKELGEDLGRQELLAEFLSSGMTLISGQKIKELEEKCIKPIEKRRNDTLWHWEEYDEISQYILSVDTALGSGRDRSCIQVLKLPITGNQIIQVGELIDNKVSPKELGMIAVGLCQEYGNALLVVEKTGGLGVATLQAALDTNYQNIFYEADLLRFVDTKQKKTTEKFENSERYIRAGFSTTLQSRPLIIHTLEDSIRKNLVKINSIRTVQELKGFVWNGSKVEAASNCNDDALLSLSIGLWVINSYIRRLPQITHQYDNLSQVYIG